MIITPDRYPDFAAAIQGIRTAVFVEEQGVSPDLEVDGLDEACVHALISRGGQAVATGRIQSDGHIGRVAVRKEARGAGLGQLVMHELVGYATAQHMQRAWLSAQCHAVGFYQALGFVAYGDVFVEAGIEHIHMQRAL